MAPAHLLQTLPQVCRSLCLPQLPPALQSQGHASAAGWPAVLCLQRALEWAPLHLEACHCSCTSCPSSHEPANTSVGVSEASTRRGITLPMSMLSTSEAGRHCEQLHVGADHTWSVGANASCVTGASAAAEGCSACMSSWRDTAISAYPEARGQGLEPGQAAAAALAP